jgi:hypothetical protein
MFACGSEVKAHEAGLSKGVTGCPVDEVVGIRMRKTGLLSEDRVVVGTVGLREYEPRLCNQAVETLVLRCRRSK